MSGTATIATYENAIAAYRIGRNHGEFGQPSEAYKWNSEFLRTTYLRGYEAGEIVRSAPNAAGQASKHP